MKHTDAYKVNHKNRSPETAWGIEHQHRNNTHGNCNGIYNRYEFTPFADFAVINNESIDKTHYKSRNAQKRIVKGHLIIRHTQNIYKIRLAVRAHHSRHHCIKENCRKIEYHFLIFYVVLF